MNDKRLTIASLIAMLFFSFHWACDIVYGMAPGGTAALYGIVILVVWLYGTVVLRDRRSGVVIMLFAGVLGVVALVLHLRGAGLVGGRMAHANGVFFWVWTLLALGVTSGFTVVLAICALWRGGRRSAS